MEPVLVYGKYTLLDKDNSSVYSYTREMNGRKILVLLNFKAHDATANTGLNLSKSKLLIDNYSGAASSETLKPYEAKVIELL